MTNPAAAHLPAVHSPAVHSPAVHSPADHSPAVHSPADHGARQMTAPVLDAILVVRAILRCVGADGTLTLAAVLNWLGQQGIRASPAEVAAAVQRQVPDLVPRTWIATQSALTQLEARLPARPDARLPGSGTPPRRTETALRTALHNAARTIDELVEIARREGWRSATRGAVSEWVLHEPGVAKHGGDGWMLPPIAVRPKPAANHRPPVVGDQREVWVTRLGTRYHLREDCGSLVVPRATSLFDGGGNSSLTAMSLAEAKTRDYEPCNGCCGASRGRR